MIVLILVVVLVLALGTKTGRATLRSAARSGHKATGWRTPREAFPHHAGRFGAQVGWLTAWTARQGRRLVTLAAKAAGRRAHWVSVQSAERMAKRWEQRAASGRAEPRPPIAWPVKPRPDAGPDGKPAGPDGSPHTTPGQGPTSDPAAAPTPSGAAGPQPSDKATSNTTPGAPRPVSPIPHAPAGAERSTAMRNRYMINLEMPSSDAEFLDSCVHLGDVLKSIAEEIGTWANGLSGLNLPTSVTQPLESISDGLVEAAAGATKAAQSFASEFEEARDVAARGMTITGQDAA